MNQADPARQARLQQARQRLDKLAWVLDESFSLPGTGKRFGIDPILGLIPGVGDLVGAGLSLYVIGEAARLGAPRRLLGRMLGNVLVETVVGLVPVAGDLFDFYWKANSRNRDLLAAHIDGQLQPPPEQRRSWLVSALLILIVMLLAVMLYDNTAAAL